MRMSEFLATRDKLVAKVAKAEADLQAAQKELQDFNKGSANAEVVMPGVPRETENVPKPSKATAPAPKADAAPKAKKTAKGTAKVTKAKAKKTVTPESKKNASEGRGAVARGDRPPLKKAMVKVMGTKVMNAAGVVEALEAKGWLPSSSDPHQYVSYMLSSNQPQVFERTEKRGHYRVRPGYLASQGNKGKGSGDKPSGNGKKATKAAAKAVATKAVKGKGRKPGRPPKAKNLDAKIQDDWGDPQPGDVDINPFKSTEAES